MKQIGMLEGRIVFLIVVVVVLWRISSVRGGKCRRQQMITSKDDEVRNVMVN